MGAQGGRALPEKRCNRFQSMWPLRQLCLHRMDERATSDHTRCLLRHTEWSSGGATPNGETSPASDAGGGRVRAFV